MIDELFFLIYIFYLERFMFTGLVEEVGKIESIAQLGKGLRITVRANRILDDLKIDDSVAINGVCQTVVARTSSTFSVEAVDETMRKTNFGQLKTGASANLERALRADSRLGGHIVQGHVDTTGTITQIIPETAGVLIRVSFPNEFRRYVAALGSITVNGISLTVARAESNNFTLSIIPHTFKSTTLSELKNGSVVNLEFDILGKYVENLLLFGNSGKKRPTSLDGYGAHFED
jgi:riboflavin synthase